MANNDQPQSPNTLPQPELNPLLNPLLADNMGRWAEVYFKAPPERREEAVFDLLRELEAERSPLTERAAEFRRSEVAREREISLSELLPLPTAIDEYFRLGHCEACGHDNPGTHQFCGMCGWKLPEQVAPGEPQEPSFDGQHRNQEMDRLPALEGSANRIDRTQPLDRNDLSLFRSVSEHNDRAESPNDEPASPRYRLYVGVALAIVLLLFGYLRWRNSQSPRNSPPVSAAETGKSLAPPVNAEKLEAPKPTASTVSTTGESTSQVDQRGLHQDPNQLTTADPKLNPPKAGSEGGSQELAMAHRYLDGTDGQERNSAEAATWLWRAMSKHNAEATLLLADLYLKGDDGVARNCDQARVLLDNAVRQGIAGAADRLRHLQAFGCQ